MMVSFSWINFDYLYIAGKMSLYYRFSNLMQSNCMCYCLIILLFFSIFFIVSFLIPSFQSPTFCFLFSFLFYWDLQRVYSLLIFSNNWLLNVSVLSFYISVFCFITFNFYIYNFFFPCFSICYLFLHFKLNVWCL